MSEQQDPESKTEDPTTKRLEEARKKGQVAQSREVNHLMILLAAALFLLLMLPGMVVFLMDRLATFIERPDQFAFGIEGIRSAFFQAISAVAIALALPILLFTVAALIAGPLQFGLVFSTEPMNPKLSKINPVEGAKRLFSMNSLMEFVKGIVKISIVAAVATFALLPIFTTIENFAGMTSGDMMLLMHTYALRVLGAVLLLVVAIAIADTMFQRYQHQKKLRMTKQEVKDEHKQSEGDPMIKQRLRRLRHEKARNRMMQNVPAADVVITNPTHFAVALAYQAESMEAPKVVAKGQDLIAKKIRDLAQENDVPMVENAPLARALHATYDIDETIQPEHYEAVAEIISYVMRLRRGGAGAAAPYRSQVTLPPQARMAG